MRGYWSSITRRLAVVRQLRSFASVALFSQIFFFSVAVPFLMRLKASRLQRLLEPRSEAVDFDPAVVARIISYVDNMQWFGYPAVRRGCLTRAVTLYFFLRRAGLSVKLCFGVGKVEGAMVGHCWLIKDAEPFLEATDPRTVFSEVFSISRDAAVSISK